ncbi:MAG: hypothetical protein AMXMBFR33_12780 [Candidatus Xenobia bacterium]
MTSPLAQALEKQITSRLRERGVVFWLDREGVYTRFVDDLSQRGDFFAPIVAFRGSFLEALLALEGQLDGLDPTALLIHLPGHTDQTVRGTPLLEAYKAGTRFERALETLVREVAAGRVPPEETEAFLGQGQRTLEDAEAWLARLGSPERTGLDQYLESLQHDRVLDALVRTPSELTERIDSDEKREILRNYLARHTGLSAELTELFLQGECARTLRALTEAWIAWLLSVEYVHDLNRPPHLEVLRPLRSLSPPLCKTCHELVTTLRKRHPERYRVYANQTESMLEAELEAGSPEELGKVDTFSREDTRLLEAALASLEQERWGQALAWAQERLEAPSVWVQSELNRRQEWGLVRDAARLGQLLVDHPAPLKGCRNLEDALASYTGGAHQVDQAHRHFEQERLQLWTPQLPHYQALERGFRRLRRAYREWLDHLTAAFNDLCSQESFLPEPRLQQRHLYDQVVHPLTQAPDGRVAFFMVDALRFEMAAELAESLEGQVHLKARYSELPSITSVGMNVLAPVCRDGNLTLDGSSFSGFRAGEYSVHTPQQRVRAMAERSLERHTGSRRTPLLLTLSEVSNTVPEKLAQKVKNAALIVVHSREIDGSGEADVGLASFDRWLGQLRSAVQHLRNAGVDEFVITSDHGFLLLDESREPYPYRGGQSSRRYVLTEHPVREESMASVPLKALNYGGAEGYLMFLRDSRVFQGRGNFVHGGNSLQERVIPVLSLSFRAARAPRLARYALSGESMPPVLGRNRLKVLLEDRSEGVLSFAVPPVLPVALRVPPDLEVEVVIEDVQGAELVNQRLHLKVGQSAEVFFKLQGGRTEKAPVELFHPDGNEEVEPCRLSVFFPVSGGQVVAEQVLSWVDHFEDQAVVRVFQHIERFGSVEEAEVIAMLGTPRRARAFTRDFDNYLRLLPFGVRIDSSAAGKRYLKD